MIVLAPSSADLSLAVRLAAVPVIMSAAELLLRREALGTGGFLDFEILGLLKGSVASRNTTMARLLRLSMGRRPYVAILVAQLLSAAAVVVVPSSIPLVTLTAGLYLLMTKRNHLSNDGSDDMVVVVLVASALAMPGSSALARTAWAVFLTGQLLLAYFVSGISKAQSDVWWRGEATTAVLRTRIFGHPRYAQLLSRHPTTAVLLTWLTFIFEVLLPAALFVLVADFPLGFGYRSRVPPLLRRRDGPKYLRLGFRRLLPCGQLVVGVVGGDDITPVEVGPRPSLALWRRSAAGVAVEPAPGRAGHGEAAQAGAALVAYHRHVGNAAPGCSQSGAKEGLRPLKGWPRPIAFRGHGSWRGGSAFVLKATCRIDLAYLAGWARPFPGGGGGRWHRCRQGD